MFQFTGKCICRRIETDRAKSADAVTKSKLKVTLPELSHESAAGVLLCDPDVPLIFFDPEQEGLPVLMKGITRIACGNAWEKMHTVKFAQLKKYAAARVQVTSLTPQPGGTFSAELIFLIENPAENFIEQMGEICNREVNIAIVQTEDDPPHQDDMEEQIAQNKKAEAKAAKAKEKQSDAFPADKPTTPTKAKPRTADEATAAGAKKKSGKKKEKPPATVVEAPAAPSSATVN